MHSTAILKLFGLLATTTSTINAAPTQDIAPADLAVNTTGVPPEELGELSANNEAIWGTFYDDDDCSVNPGMDFSTENAHCLRKQRGRGSIQFQAAFTFQGHTSMIVSPGWDCDCQAACVESIFGEGRGRTKSRCFKLTEWQPYAGSYRFIRGLCPKMECMHGPPPMKKSNASLDGIEEE